MFKIPFLLHGMALPELVLQVVHIVYLVAPRGAGQYWQELVGGTYFQNHLSAFVERILFLQHFLFHPLVLPQKSKDIRHLLLINLFLQSGRHCRDIE